MNQVLLIPLWRRLAKAGRWKVKGWTIRVVTVQRMRERRRKRTIDNPVVSEKCKLGHLGYLDIADFDGRAHVVRMNMDTRVSHQQFLKCFRVYCAKGLTKQIVQEMKLNDDYSEPPLYLHWNTQ